MDTVNKQQLAEQQGVSLPTITRWMAEGMPVAEKGGRGKGYAFDPAAVTEWRVERAKKKALGGASEETEAMSKRRKTAAEADIQEMKAAQLRGELCVQADLVADIQNDLSKVRARLLAIPSRAAAMVVGQDEHTARKFLQDLIYEALDEVSTIDMDEFFEPFEQKQEDTKNSSGITLHSGRFLVDLLYDSDDQCNYRLESVDFH